MLALRLAFSKGISDVQLLKLSSQTGEVCKSCLVRRHLSLPSWYPKKLKKGHSKVISIPSVRWQTNGTSKDGPTAEGTNEDTTTNLDNESASSAKDDDGKIVISFEYEPGIPLHHQLKKCMEDKTLTITHTKGKEIDKDNPSFSWPVRPKRQAKRMFDEDEKLIEEARALADYLLQPRHLQDLRSIKIRNAYRNIDRKYVRMFSVTDIQQKTIEVWGTMERMHNIRKKHNYKTRDEFIYSSGQGVDANNNLYTTIMSPSGKVVVFAIVANCVNTGIKAIAWGFTGSDSFFAEMIHSLVDAANQCIMLFGLYSSNKAPNPNHPYGYTSHKYLTAFTAGVGICIVGGIVNMSYGGLGLFYHTEPYHFSPMAVCIMMATTAVEGGSLAYAYYEARKKMKQKGRQVPGLIHFIQQGVDPSMTVVLLEDFASVLGNIVALLCYWGGTYYTCLDSVGSMIVGGLLFCVGGVITRENYLAIAEKSVDASVKQAIQDTMESDRIVRSVHDMKVVQNRVKAEIDFNGREIARQYLLEKDKKAILEELQFMANEIEANEFLLDFGDGVINQLGKGVDRLEVKIKTKHPNVRHVDLESL